MIRSILVLVLFSGLVDSAYAKSRNGQECETQYLEDADRYIREGPVEVKTASTPVPITKETPVPTPRAIAPTADQADEDEEEENGERTILGYSKKVRASPPAIIRDSRIFVGEEVPYPNAYSAPVIHYDANGIPYVTLWEFLWKVMGLDNLFV